MALAPIVNPTPLSDVQNPDSKMGSELNDAFVKAVKQLGKKKGYAEDAAAAQAIIAQQPVPLQDRKVQFAKKEVSAGQVQSADVANSLRGKKELKQNAVAMAVQSVVVPQSKQEYPTTSVPQFVDSQNDVPRTTAPIKDVAAEATSSLQEVAAMTTVVVGSAPSPASRERVGERALETQGSVDEHPIGKEKQKSNNTSGVATTLTPATPLSREAEEGAKQPDLPESYLNKTAQVNPAQVTTTSSNAEASAEFAPLLHSAPVGTTLPPQAVSTAISPVISDEIPTGMNSRTPSSVPRESVGVRAVETKQNIDKNSVFNKTEKQELNSTASLAFETGEEARQPYLSDSYSNKTPQVAPAQDTTIWPTSEVSAEFMTHSAPIDTVALPQAVSTTTPAVISDAIQTDMDGRTPSPASRESVGVRAVKTGKNIDEHSVLNKTENQKLNSTDSIAPTFSREAKQPSQFQSRPSSSVSQVSTVAPSQVAPSQEAASTVQPSVLHSSISNTERAPATPTMRAPEAFTPNNGTTTISSQVIPATAAQIPAQGVTPPTQAGIHRTTISTQNTRTLITPTSSKTTQTQGAHSAIPTRSISDKVVVSKPNDLSISKQESVKSEKFEASELTSALTTPSMQSPVVQKASPEVHQKQGSQPTTRQRADTFASGDQNNVAPAETKFKFAWGADQSVVITGTSETGYKLRASDNQVKQILDQHLDNQGSASSLGITSIETATDKHPKQRQPTNHNHADDADE